MQTLLKIYKLKSILQYRWGESHFKSKPRNDSESEFPEKQISQPLKVRLFEPHPQPINRDQRREPHNLEQKV